jgi:hypothetical protein
MEPFKLMEPFTSLLITRNLERAPLIILTFVQRLLVRDHTQKVSFNIHWVTLTVAGT